MANDVTVASSQARTGWRWRGAAVLGLIVAGAGALRFYRLGSSSMWIDEGASMTMARLPWGELFRTLWQYEANMTAYYLLLRAWVQLGDSEAVVRSLSALCGTAAVAAIFFLGRRLFDERTGIVASALLAVNTFHVWLTQEARSYGLVMLLAILSLHLFAMAVSEPRRHSVWAGYIFVTVLAAYGHLFATLIIPAQWLAVGPRTLRMIGTRRLAVVGLAVAMALLPLALFVLGRDQGQLNWVPPFDASSVLLMLFGINGFNALATILVLAGLYRAARRLKREDAFDLRLVASGLVVPVVIIALASLVKPLFFFRYFAVCVPATVLLAASVLAATRDLSKAGRRFVAAVGGLTILVSIVITASYYERMKDWGGDWRAATEYVLAHRREGDALAFYASAGLDSYRYYRDRVPGRKGDGSPPRVVFPPEGALASVHLEPTYEVFADVAKRHPRLWVVLHQKEPGSLPFPFPRPFRLIDQRDFTTLAPEMRLSVSLYATQ